MSKDGTINYLTLRAVTDGLRFLSLHLPYLPLRLSCLLHFITSSLSRLRHNPSGTPVVRILSQLPGRRLRSVGEQADTGSTVSMVFLSVSLFYQTDDVYISLYSTSMLSAYRRNHSQQVH